MIPRFNCDYPVIPALKALVDSGSVDGRGQFDTASALWLSSGRVALYLALLAFFPKGGKRIGVQAFTCRVVLEAIRRSGNEPFFLDIDSDYCVSLPDLERKVAMLDALIVTHTFGIPADLLSIQTLLRGKPLIEDCAHALSSAYAGTLVGDVGGASIFSFGFGKPLSVGTGGILKINDSTILARASSAAKTIASATTRLGSVKSVARGVACSVLHRRALYSTLTYPVLKRANRAMDLTEDATFRITRGLPSARVLVEARMSEYQSRMQSRRERAARLAGLLVNALENIWHYDTPQRRYNAYLFPLRVSTAYDAVSFMRANGFEAARHFSASTAMAASYGYRPGDCPNTEVIVSELFTVPVHEGVSMREIERCAALLDEGVSTQVLSPGSTLVTTK